jgi:hypothetical protein
MKMLDTPMVRGTHDYHLMLDILHSKTYVADGQGRRINGRYVKVAFLVLDAEGKPTLMPDRQHLAITWKRVRIPRGHAWRGTRQGLPVT